MSAFDRIIGYEVIRKELERTADALKNTAAYAALGVAAPKGLLLHGEPGVGKSLMASCLIEESGRNVLTLRRDEPDGDFVRAIKETFDKAAAGAPSIVFLDDMDKFAKTEDDCSNQEEFVAVQAAIDKVKDKDVFVLATANVLHVLPHSLIRPGRFDRVIEVDSPSACDAPKIIAHFLEGKPLDLSVDTNVIARILNGRSCAELETAMNVAGLLVAFERGDKITMQHIIMGCVSVIHGITADHIVVGRNDDPYDSKSVMSRVACHEAGHAVVAEVLCPGSVALACIHEPHDGSRGFVAYSLEDEGLLEQDVFSVVRLLAGNAALEQRFGVGDAGAENDTMHAQGRMRDIIAHNSYRGNFLLESSYQDSPQLLANQETAVFVEMERCARKARQILVENKAFLEAVIEGLLQKGLLTGDEIQAIRQDCEQRKSA